MRRTYIIFITVFFAIGNNIQAQIKAITQDGKTVILLRDGTWRYLNTSTNQTLSEQYDEIARYAKDKLELDVDSYSSARRKEAKEYVENQIEQKGYPRPNQTLSEQYDEIARFAKDKLELDIDSYSSTRRKEAKEYIKDLIEQKGYLRPNQTLSEQYNEVARYVDDKLGLDVDSYSSRTREEVKEYINTLIRILNKS